ncbi:MAG: LysM domain-containing protein, partial [Gallionellaceae bacterium]|nr:LysM domain-containing protein [Gallionellaceae bacterium]
MIKLINARGLCLLLAVAVLAGCASRGHAPVQDRTKKSAAKKSALRDNDWRPKIYVVQKGDTLYSIAFNHGLDYHEIAELNGLKNPSMISIGQ